MTGKGIRALLNCFLGVHHGSSHVNVCSNYSRKNYKINFNTFKLKILAVAQNKKVFSLLLVPNVLKTKPLALSVKVILGLITLCKLPLMCWFLIDNLKRTSFTEHFTLNMNWQPFKKIFKIIFKSDFEQMKGYMTEYRRVRITKKRLKTRKTPWTGHKVEI